MNTLDLFFQWLLAASLRASVLALAVLVLQLALSRWLPARWRHALWLPVVLVLVAPMLPASRFSIENRFRTQPVAVPAAPAAAVAQQASTEGRAVTAPPTLEKPASWRPTSGQWLFGTWLLGACSVLVAGGIGYRRSLRRIARGAVPTSAGIRDSVARAAEQLGLKRVPSVILSSAVDSPAVAGLLRPVLLLPAQFPQGFSANEARLVLLHELTHLKRHDLPLNWLLCVLQALHWFNPLLWLAFARMRADRETACDAQVLAADAEDRRADYGHALLKLQNSVSGSGLSLAFVGIFARAGMRSRIRAIATHRRTHPAWGLAAALLIATLTLGGATRAQETAGKIVDQQTKAGWGTFVSFTDGTLTLKGQHGGLVWKDLNEKIPVFQWDNAAREYRPASPAEVLGKVEAGTWIFVTENRSHIRVGAAKEGRTTGTFVSFKNDRMLLLGKDLPVSNFTKKYGNHLNYPKFDENIPVFESIDGGDYMLAGTPSTTLPKVKEGTLVTVYFGPNDGHFTRIEIGVRVTTAVPQASATDATDRQEKAGWGKFVSFQDGTLKLKGNYGPLVWNNVAADTKVVHWDDAAKEYKPSGTAEVLGRVEAGTWITVVSKREIIRVGAKKSETIGTFVSYKDDRLLMLGKNLGGSFAKKYGNNVHFNKFAEGVPVYESVDGSDYALTGIAEKILPTVKEGTVLAVHGAGDDNITRIDIGVPTKK